MKCQKKDCVCSSSEPPTSKLWSFINSHGFFTPEPSVQFEGSYKTYLEMKFLKCFVHNLHAAEKKSRPTVCPSLKDNPPLLCHDSACQDLQFFSKTALERHNRLVHRSRKRQNSQETVHVCTFENCQKNFKTCYQLQKHKEQEGHKVKRGRKSLN